MYVNRAIQLPLIRYHYSHNYIAFKKINYT